MPADHPLVDKLPALQDAFAACHAASRQMPEVDLRVRLRRLDALDQLVRDHMAAFCTAIAQDFGRRSPHETQLLEIFPSLEGIRHARCHLRRWMKPQRRPVSLWFQPGRAEVQYQPLGCVGIVVPWNYPLYLAIGPLTAAFAAGNRALVKMSEFTPATARLLAQLAGRYFSRDELTIVEGEAEVAQAFVRLPFDHLLFTGSTAVGRQVMRAAAEHLTPVTLELGGKSPTLICPDFPLNRAVDRILSGKCLNAGQTCIAPDYVLLPAGLEEAFTAEAKRWLAKAYPNFATNPDFSAIINDRHVQRLSRYLEDAQAQGARLVPLADEAAPDPVNRRFTPTLVLGGTDSMAVMQEEIFGPLLPIVPYHSLEDALAYINRRDRPLALYVFDNDGARVKHILNNTIAGGVTVNDTLLHIAQDELPFGGIGASGMGHYHGHAGFLTFSKQKPVFRQARLNGLGLFKPPYGKRFETLIKVLLR